MTMRGITDPGTSQDNSNPYLPPGFNSGSTWNGMESTTNAGPFGRGLADTGAGASQPSSSAIGSNPLGQISGISHAMQTGTLQQHQDSDWESWMKAGGGGYAQPASQGGSAYYSGTVDPSTNPVSTAYGTNSDGSPSASSSAGAGNSWNTLTNRPADW